MRQASRRDGHLSDDCRTDVPQRIADFLRRRYPVSTALNVAADTGIQDETVQKMLDRVSMPSGFNLLRLLSVYGPPLFSVMVDDLPEWVSDAARAEKIKQADRNLAAALAAREALGSAP